MTQDEAFLQAIWEDLTDDTPWLVYADWLEERGDPRAELYRHRRLTNSIGMQFVLVPPGKFLMGSPETEAMRRSDEGPQHEVEITQEFYLGVFPVTQEQYEKVGGFNPSRFSHKHLPQEVAGLDTRRFPVEHVSWHQAVDFCRRLSELLEESRHRRLYRLPTEAEWEYAAREGGRSQTPFHFGASLSSAQANFDGNFPYGGADKGPRLDRPTPVGSYPCNALGLYDIHGNVLEWCSDWYDPDYYRRSPKRDPQGPTRSRRKGRVLRGGSLGQGSDWCRAAWRWGREPGERAAILGFRVALVVGATTA